MKALELQLPSHWNIGNRLTIHQGEIVGLLDSYGTQSSYLLQIFQSQFPYYVSGKVCKNYREACKAGLGLVSLHCDMLLPQLSFNENLLLLKMQEASRFFIRNYRIEKYCVSQYSPNFDHSIQQHEQSWERLKLIIYRWALVCPKILVIEDPPFDLTNEQQDEFLSLLQTIAHNKCAILLISSAKNECQCICGRVIEIKEKIV